MEGWIKIHRKILNDPLYFAEPFTRMQAFLDLVLIATRQQVSFFKRGIKITVERGQIVKSENEFAERWKWSRGKVRRFLDGLENGHKIVQQKSRLCNCISIVNYDKYQIDDTTDSTTDSTTDGTTDGTTKYKKDNMLSLISLSDSTTDGTTDFATDGTTKNKKEYILSSSTTSTVRAREGLSSSSGVRPDGIDGDISMLRGSPSWLEQIMMRHKVTEPDLDVLFGEFAAECRCNGLERHVDINDAKRHFNNWLRIYLKQQRNQNGTKDRGHRPSASENIAAAQREELERTAALLRGSEGGD